MFVPSRLGVVDRDFAANPVNDDPSPSFRERPHGNDLPCLGYFVGAKGSRPGTRSVSVRALFGVT